ncbi:MAG: hypothetical protein QXP60_06490, partial [Nitrososphaerota archaeon]
YLKDPQNYNPEKAWKKAIKRITKGASKVFIKFAIHSRMSPLNFVESENLIENINKVCCEGNAALISINKIEKSMYELNNLTKDIEKLLKNENKKLLKEIKPLFPKLMYLSGLGLKAIQLLKITDENLCRPITNEILFLMRRAKRDKHQLMGEYALRSPFLCGSNRKNFESYIFQLINAVFSWKVYEFGEDFNKIIKFYKEDDNF